MQPSDDFCKSLNYLSVQYSIKHDAYITSATLSFNGPVDNLSIKSNGHHSNW